MKTTPKNNARGVRNPNAQLITEKWAPMIERTTGVKDPEKLAWMSQLAHNTAKSINEDLVPGIGLGQTAGVQNAAMGGVYSPYATLYNTPGVGDVIPAGQPALTAADYASNTNLGSGDKMPALLPLALKVAAKTIGFDLVNTLPLSGPAGVLPYMDYVYAGGKQPYGAMPGFDGTHTNPSMYSYDNGKVNGGIYGRDYADGVHGNVTGVPSAFKAAWVADAANIDADDETAGAAKDSKATGVFMQKKLAVRDAGILVSGIRFKSGEFVVEFVGYSRIDGDLMFKVITAPVTLGELFAGGKVKFEPVLEAGETLKYGDETLDSVTLSAPRLVSMLEDQLQGFAGSGARNQDPWQGTYQDGMTLYNPMSRGTGEMTPARQLSLQLFTKNIQVGTVTVGCSVTQEQVTDLQKQWGIDVVKMVENAGITELTNTINRHITSLLFGLGWKNHCKLVQVEGMSANLNLTFDPQNAKTVTPAFAIPQHPENIGTDLTAYADFGPAYVNVPLPFKPLYINETAQFENRDTLLKRVATNIMLASNWIHQRGRYGAATFVVTNITVATALQSNAHYTFSPVDNNINQTSGQLYNIGTLAGLQVYVDPNMAATDCRVLVGRKGAKDEAGVFFCPYVLADSVRIISEGTMAPKLAIKSRYTLACAGFFPETQYLTFFIDFAGLV